MTTNKSSSYFIVSIQIMWSGFVGFVGWLAGFDYNDCINDLRFGLMDLSLQMSGNEHKHCLDPPSLE